MDHQPREIPSSPRSTFGPLQEMRHVQVNGSASVAELKEFLDTLKGRSPQQVIGIVSSSLLIQSLGLATLATVLLLAVFTVGPYLLAGPPRSKEIANKAASPPAAAPVSERAASASSTAPATAAPNSLEGATSGASDAEKAAKAMGLDEVKSADPLGNPLDRPDLDKLLDGIDE